MPRENVGHHVLTYCFATLVDSIHEIATTWGDHLLFSSSLLGSLPCWFLYVQREKIFVVCEVSDLR